MKICISQTKPAKGDIQNNLKQHIKMITLAVDHKADAIIFPELSLTGYEPTLAQALAITSDDTKLDTFQQISDEHQIIIGAGMPTQQEAGICISLILFQPNQSRQTYSKKYLHADEEPFFVSGKNFPILTINETNLAFAICYELTVPHHAKTAVSHQAQIYIASVAKTAAGVEQAYKRLAHIAQTHALPVLMSNCVGPSDNFISAGGTAVWHQTGQLAAALDDTHQGLIIYDTETKETVIISI